MPAVADRDEGRPPSLPAAARAEVWLLALCTLAWLALGFLAPSLFLSSGHTLEANGRWLASKTTLARAVMGAQSFVGTGQALAGGHLDLGAWHGFQEVFWYQPLDLERLDFDLWLPTASHLSVLFACVESEGCAGFRLSAKRGLPSLFVWVDPAGGFLERRPLDLDLAANRWHRVSVEIEGGAARLAVGDERLGPFAAPRRGPGSFGFRGSLAGGVVDGIVALAADGTSVSEDFDAAPRAAGLRALAAAALVALGLAVFALLVVGVRLEARLAAQYTLMVSATLLVLVVLLLAALRLREARYPAADAELVAAEDEQREATAAHIRSEIRRRYGSTPRPGTTRVLLVGSSQTWGAGASRPEETWARILEQRLNAAVPPGRRVECIEAGISATRARDLAPWLEEEWLALAPDVVVINLSSNDADLSRFVPPLERMTAAARAAGAEVLLMQEANARAPANTHLRLRHQAMAEVGARHGASILDMHGYLLSVEERGFLWWDKVHLTSFGQRLLAERLAAELVPLLTASGPAELAEMLAALRRRP